MGPTVRAPIYQGRSNYSVYECSTCQNRDQCWSVDIACTIAQGEQQATWWQIKPHPWGLLLYFALKEGCTPLTIFTNLCRLSALYFILTLSVITVIAASWQLSAEFWPLLLLSPIVQLCSCLFYVSPVLQSTVDAPLTSYSWWMVLLDSLMEYKSLMGILTLYNISIPVCPFLLTSFFYTIS